jgi:transposase
VALGVTAAQEHESKHFTSMLDAVAIPGKPGRPLKRPKHVVGDKGYSSTANRQAAKKRRIIPIIAQRSNQTCQDFFDKELYRGRNVVEREIGWLKESRSIGTRYEKLALNSLGLVTIACIVQYLKLLESVF